MPEVFKKLNISGVRVESYVEDATAYIADKGINIVPLKSGSGIRLKILEAMSAGKLVISTTIGAQGIHSIDGKHLLIADTPEQFLEKMKWVQENPDKAQDMMHQARILIETEYSNHSVIERLLAHFQRLLAQKK
jgi:glycosyltransferase involved in cell wall biosynthesis